MTSRIPNLDLSFLNPGALEINPQSTGVSGPSTRDVAQLILANTKWGSLPLSDLKGPTAEAPHNKSFISRIADLLSTPSYAVANAADKMMAGHESSNNDSVLSDALKVTGGALKGAATGAYAGLKGTFGTDAAANDPSNKTHFSDVILKHTTLGKTLTDPNASQFDFYRSHQQNAFDNPTIEDMAKMTGKSVQELQKPITDEQRKTLQHEMVFAGLGSDIISDPLNFFNPLGWVTKVKRATTAAEDLTAGKYTVNALKDTSKGTQTADALNSGAASMPNTSGYTMSPGSIKLKPATTPVAVQNVVANGGKNIITPSWFNFPKTASEMGNAVADAAPVAEQVATRQPADIFNDMIAQMVKEGELNSAKATEAAAPVPKPSEAPSGPVTEASTAPSDPAVRDLGGYNPKTIKNLAGQILRHAATGRKNWTYDVNDMLSRHTGMNWDNTLAELDRFSNAVAKRGGDVKTALGTNPRLRQQFASRIHDALTSDITASRATARASDLVDGVAQGSKAADNIVSGAAEAAPVAESKYQDIIDQVVNHFTPMFRGEKDFTGAKNSGSWSKGVRAGIFNPYSPGQQAQIWSMVVNALTKRGRNIKTASTFKSATGIVKQIEDHFIQQGFKPASHPHADKSFQLRLSEVANHLGAEAIARDPKLITKILDNIKNGQPLPPRITQMVEAAKAKHAIEDAPAVAEGIKVGSDAATAAGEGIQSAARNAESTTLAGKTAEDIARQAGASTSSAAVAKSYVLSNFLKNDAIESAVLRNVGNNKLNLAHDTLNPKYSTLPALTRGIQRQLGSPAPHILGKLYGPAARAGEWLGARFNAAYGNADMRPIYLENAALAKQNVALRAAHLNQLVRQYGRDKDAWQAALRSAQGIIPPADETTRAMSAEILKVMENLVGSSGLKDQAILAHTVTGRSGLLMRELNANLKRFGLPQFKFVAGKLKNADGVEHDFSQGIDWMKSWETWDIKNPLEFMMKFQNAVEHTLREKTMFDEIASRFGTITRVPGTTSTVAHPRLAGYYFTKEGAQQATQFVKMLKDTKNLNSPAMQLFDKVLSKFKASVTIYFPVHHIRNAIGDIYFNWLAGVNKPTAYSDAIRVMRGQQGRYTIFRNMDDPLEQVSALAGKSPSRNPRGTDIAVTMANGRKLSIDQVYSAAYRNGILPSAHVLEDIPEEASVLDRIGLPGKLRGRGQLTAHQIAEAREHWIRLSQFIDSLSKSRKPFEEATKQAAAEVRKWHPDGMDLTKAERTVMRRLFPFYSWTRKALPLVVESAFTKAPKVMLYPRLTTGAVAYNNDNPQNVPGVDDPFPTDQLFPDWMRDMGIGPILGGSQGNYSLINPSNPSLDLISQIGHPFKTLGSMANPAARIPFELAAGTDIGTGAPIDDYAAYATKQLPIISKGGQLTNFTIGGTNSKYDQQGPINWANIANFLTGAGYRDTSPYQKSAQYDLRDYLKSQRG